MMRIGKLKDSNIAMHDDGNGMSYIIDAGDFQSSPQLGVALLGRTRSSQWTKELLEEGISRRSGCKTVSHT